MLKEILCIGVTLLLCGVVKAEEVQGDRVMDRVFPFYAQRLGGGQCVYDSVRKIVVRFGGETEVPVREGGAPLTSEWDGTNWVSLTLDPAPPFQSGFTMIYDVARSNVVLFGGYPASDATWLYSGTNWIEANPAHRPPARWSHDMVYDSARSKVIVFGGTPDPVAVGGNKATNTFSDTWEWDGSDWTNRVTTTTPPGLYGPQMAYDASRGVTVMCKGNIYGYFGWFMNTNQWEYNGTDWTNKTPAVMPPMYEVGPLVYNPQRAVVELFNFGTTNGSTISPGGYCKLWTYVASSMTWTSAVFRTGPKDDSALPAAWLGDRISRDIDYLWPSGTAVFHLSTKNNSGPVPSSGRTWLWSGSNWTCKTPFTALLPLFPSYWGESAMGDVNGDGLPDLLLMGWIRNATNDALTYGPAVFLHNGTNLAANPVWTKASTNATPAVTPQYPWRVALGDITGDGRADAAIGGSFSNRIQVYASTGGTLSSNMLWEWSVRSNTVATLGIVDVDGDTRQDLVALAKGSLTSNAWAILIFTNSGGTLQADPSFTYLLPWLTTSTPPEVITLTDGSLRWADVNYDGRQEFAVACNGRVDVLNWAGTNLVLATRLEASSLPMGFADVDSDGYPDLVTGISGSSSGRLALFPNVAGTIQPTAVWEAAYYEDEPKRITAGDADGDGDPELVLGGVNQKASGVFGGASLFRNDAGGWDAYPDWQAEENLEKDFPGPSVKLVDFDGDGVLDVITDKGVYLMDRKLRGRSPLPPRYAAGVAGLPGDTGVTLHWDPSSDASVSAYRIYGRGNLQQQACLIGTVPASQTTFVDTQPNPLNNYYVTSVDQAGYESVAAPVDAIASLPAVRVGGDGKPDYSFMGACTFTPSGLSAQPRFGDVNADGYPDILVTRAVTGPLGPEGSWALWLNTTNGFSLAWAPHWGATSPGAPVALQDVNGDGRADLVLSSSRTVDLGGGTNSVCTELDFYLSIGGGFATNPISSVALPISALGSLSFGDPDGDGDKDFALSEQGGGSALLYLNNGGVFSPTPAWTSSVGNVTLLAFGHPNTNIPNDTLAVATYNIRQRVYLYDGASNGLMKTASWFGTNLNAAASATYKDGETAGLSWADFTADGLPDLTVFNEQTTYAYSNQAGVITGPGTSSSSTNYTFLLYQPAYPSERMTHFLRGWADLDGSGIMDLYGMYQVIRDAGTFRGLMNDSNYLAWSNRCGNIGSGELTSAFIDQKWGKNVTGNSSGHWYPVEPLTAVDVNRDNFSDLVVNQGYMIFLGATNLLLPPVALATNFTVLPSTMLSLEGPGAEQALTLLAQLNNGITTDVTDSASFSVQNNGTIPVISVSGNVVTAISPSPVNVGDTCLKCDSDIPRSLGVSSMPTVYVNVRSRPPRPVALRLTPATETLTRQGEPLYLAVVETMEGGTENDVTPLTFFSNSVPSVLSLSGNCVLPLQNGSATLFASHAGLMATSTVTVSLSTSLARIDLVPSVSSIEVGGRQAYELTARFGDGSSEVVTFLGSLISSDNGVARPVGNGVTGVGPGLALISAVYGGMTSAVARVMVQSSATNAPPIFQITDYASSQSEDRLGWYCTTRPGTTNRFAIYAASNLAANVWWPVQTHLPRWPMGFSTSCVSRVTNSPALFYRVGVE